MSSIQTRLEALEELVEQHVRKIVMLETELARQGRELELARGPIPQVVSRGGHKYVKRDPTVRAAVLARTAAKARASKPIGDGKGAVRSQRTAARLKKQMQQLDADEQAAIESGTRGRARKKGHADGRRR